MLLEFMQSPRGQALDRFLVRWMSLSPLSILFARKHGYPFPPAPLLLVATGRTSGKKRAVVLPFFEIDGSLFVVGSNGGAQIEPHWVGNLRSNPVATVYIRRKAVHVTTRISVGDERGTLWGKLIAFVPTYAQYQTQTDREIPLILLEKSRQGSF